MGEFPARITSKNPVLPQFPNCLDPELSLYYFPVLGQFLFNSKALGFA